MKIKLIKFTRQKDEKLFGILEEIETLITPIYYIKKVHINDTSINFQKFFQRFNQTFTVFFFPESLCSYHWYAPFYM